MTDVFNTSTYEIELPEIEESVATELCARVILYNDEWHTFDEVIEQIMKATGCSLERAEKLTNEVHFSGKSCVYEGDFMECMRVSSILEEIALYTQIEY